MRGRGRGRAWGTPGGSGVSSPRPAPSAAGSGAATSRGDGAGGCRRRSSPAGRRRAARGERRGCVLQGSLALSGRRGLRARMAPPLASRKPWAGWGCGNRGPSEAGRGMWGLRAETPLRPEARPPGQPPPAPVICLEAGLPRGFTTSGCRCLPVVVFLQGTTRDPGSPDAVILFTSGE